jgi:hypothetical protein
VQQLPDRIARLDLFEVAERRVPGDRLANSEWLDRLRLNRLWDRQWLHGFRSGRLLSCRWLDRLPCWRGDRRDGLNGLAGSHHLRCRARSLWFVIGQIRRDGVGLLWSGGEQAGGILIATLPPPEVCSGAGGSAPKRHRRDHPCSPLTITTRRRELFDRVCSLADYLGTTLLDGARGVARHIDTTPQQRGRASQRGSHTVGRNAGA